MVYIPEFRAWHKNTNYMCQNVKTDLLDRDYLEFLQYIGLNTIIGDLKIYVKDLLKDEEGFIWEVLPLSDGMFKIYCSDLNAVESAYPRAVGCELIGNICEKDKLSPEDLAKI